ncbi:uncharacterized protein LOC124976341 [Sciurus carolinensis]|uniref:uncharacterized protein LOC124976341 n=1 Tax=Sciurus carolinensis TaxID=30640 RepID=UPI001FB53B51|nr:uncharacterized protein LOC124976341 [Sciurus carolinensis]
MLLVGAFGGHVRQAGRVELRWALARGRLALSARVQERPGSRLRHVPLGMQRGAIRALLCSCGSHGSEGPGGRRKRGGHRRRTARQAAGTGAFRGASPRLGQVCPPSRGVQELLRGPLREGDAGQAGVSVWVSGPAAGRLCRRPGPWSTVSLFSRMRVLCVHCSGGVGVGGVARAWQQGAQLCRGRRAPMTSWHPCVHGGVWRGRSPCRGRFPGQLRLWWRCDEEQGRQPVPGRARLLLLNLALRGLPWAPCRGRFPGELGLWWRCEEEQGGQATPRRARLLLLNLALHGLPWSPCRGRFPGQLRLWWRCDEEQGRQPVPGRARLLLLNLALRGLPWAPCRGRFPGELGLWWRCEEEQGGQPVPGRARLLLLNLALHGLPWRWLSGRVAPHGGVLGVGETLEGP